MREPRDIIIAPIITEEALAGNDLKKYTFEVDKRANKIEIAEAIEAIFDVKVKKVNTMNMRGKVKRRGYDVGRRRNWKKAIVTLTDDSKDIEIIAG